MQENLFGVVNLDETKKKKRLTPLAIHLPLGVVCVNDSQCRSIPYSPNFLNRKHWAVRSRWKKAWEEELWGRWQEEKHKWKEYKFPLDFKVEIAITIFCIKRQDEDNSYASLKGIIDGLTIAGIIKDDSYEYVKLSVQHILVKKKIAEHIEIMIKKHKRK